MPRRRRVGELVVLSTSSERNERSGNDSLSVYISCCSPVELAVAAAKPRGWQPWRCSLCASTSNAGTLALFTLVITRHFHKELAVRRGAHHRHGHQPAKPVGAILSVLCMFKASRTLPRVLPECWNAACASRLAVGHPISHVASLTAPHVILSHCYPPFCPS